MKALAALRRVLAEKSAVRRLQSATRRQLAAAGDVTRFNGRGYRQLGEECRALKLAIAQMVNAGGGR